MPVSIPFPILYEDNHLLVVNKPAGIATQGAAPGEASVAELAKRYLKQKYDKPGNVYLGVVSRLDSMVTGTLVLARTSKAAARLSEQFRSRTVEKTYWAVVPSNLPDGGGEWVDYLRKNESQHRMVTCDASHSEAQLARLSYRRLQTLPGKRQLVEVALETGRKHQIRVQFSSRDCAIIGDRKYDSPHAFSNGIALHSRELSFAHPTTKEPLTFTANLPTSWDRFGIKT